MEALKLFNYNDNAISFRSENGTAFINATEMANQFKKKPVEWLRLPSTKEYMVELSKVRKSHFGEMVKTVKGGNDTSLRGTWLHEDVALEFSRWLSPTFAIWCNDRIKELLRYGMTATQPTIDDMIADPEHAIRLLTALTNERKEKAMLQQQLQSTESQLSYKDEIIELQDRNLKAIAPKAEYADKVLQSDSTYATTRIAQEFGMSAVSFNQRLLKEGIQRKVDGQWVLYAKYQGQGYTKPHTVTYTKHDGTTGTNTQTVWTEKGRKFIHDLMSK